MIIIKRTGLILSLSSSVPPSMGSENVRVEIVDDGTYSDYNESIRIGYDYDRKDGILKFENGYHVIPPEPFKYGGCLTLAVALQRGKEIVVTRPLILKIPEAPMTNIELVDEVTWHQIVENYVSSQVGGYKEAFEQNATEKTSAFNQNAINKTNDFNSNVTTKTGSFDTHVGEQIKVFNNNASEKNGALNTTISTATQTITQMKNDVATLKTQVETAKQDVINERNTVVGTAEAINQEILKLKNRLILNEDGSLKLRMEVE